MLPSNRVKRVVLQCRSLEKERSRIVWMTCALIGLWLQLTWQHVLLVVLHEVFFYSQADGSSACDLPGIK
jgi:hypothetical protein